MNRSVRRLGLLLVIVLLLLVSFDRLVFPGGFPRELPFLRWKAEHDPFLYTLMPHTPVDSGELTVCVIGSSMVKKGVHDKTIEGALEEILGRTVRAYNFGIGGAFMCDFLLGLNHALKVNPDIIVIGTSLRDYPTPSAIDPKGTAAYEILCDPDFNLPEFMALHGAEERIGHTVKIFWRSFKFRNWIRMNASAFFGAIANPMANRDRSFFMAKVAPDWTAFGEKVDAFYKNVAERSYPNLQVRCLEQAVETGRRTGARVIVINLPVSSLWFSHDEWGIQLELDTILRTTCSKRRVDYVDARSSFPDGNFVDSSHLNHEGALSFSRWLAGTIADRRLFGPASTPKN